MKSKIELAEYFFINYHSRACKLRILTNLAGNRSDVDGCSIQFSDNQFVFTFQDLQNYHTLKKEADHCEAKFFFLSIIPRRKIKIAAHPAWTLNTAVPYFEIKITAKSHYPKSLRSPLASMSCRQEFPHIGLEIMLRTISTKRRRGIRNLLIATDCLYIDGPIIERRSTTSFDF